MTISMARLHGDRAIIEAEKEMEPLLHVLDRMEAAGEKCLQVNCSRMTATDIGDLNLLLFLFESARLRGIETRLMDMTMDIKRAVHALGFMHCFLGAHHVLLPQTQWRNYSN